MSTKIAVTSYDEEVVESFADRAKRVVDLVVGNDLDLVNKQYIVTVELVEVQG